MDCRDPNHFCVAALQQKRQKHVVQESFRNQPAKKIQLNFEITYVWKRPESYISKLRKRFR